MNKNNQINKILVLSEGFAEDEKTQEKSNLERLDGEILMKVNLRGN